MQLFCFTFHFITFVIISLLISSCKFSRVWVWWRICDQPFTFWPSTCPQPLLKCPTEFSSTHKRIKFTFNANLCVSLEPNKPVESISLWMRHLQRLFLKNIWNHALLSLCLIVWSFHHCLCRNTATFCGVLLPSASGILWNWLQECISW